MSGKHTPGPWRLDPSDSRMIWGACDPDDVSTNGFGYPVASIEQPRQWMIAGKPGFAEREANARLIAAAPDLLEALDDAPIMSKYHGAGFDAARFIADYEAWRVKARAALAKARASGAAPHE